MLAHPDDAEFLCAGTLARLVTEKGFKEKLNSIDRYILLDLRNLKNGTYDTIEVTKEDIKMLNLGKNKTIEATKFFKIYDKVK